LDVDRQVRIIEELDPLLTEGVKQRVHDVRVRVIAGRGTHDCDPQHGPSGRGGAEDPRVGARGEHAAADRRAGLGGRFDGVDRHAAEVVLGVGPGPLVIEVLARRDEAHEPRGVGFTGLLPHDIDHGTLDAFAGRTARMAEHGIDGRLQLGGNLKGRTRLGRARVPQIVRDRRRPHAGNVDAVDLAGGRARRAQVPF